MRVWIFEDRADKIRNIEKGLRTGGGGKLTFEHLQTVEAGDRALEEIGRDDLVLVDSQVPSEATGLPVSCAGERFVARLRAAGCECRVFWNSDAYVESLGGLGVVDLNARGGAANLATAVFGPARSDASAASKEEWRRNGEALLAKLTAPEVPLSEFAALSALCQGYLAVVGAAGRFENEVADELRRFEGGRECLAEARGHLVEALDAARWFAEARENVAGAVCRRGGDQEDYWRGVCDGRAELKADVAAIRALCEMPGRAETGGPDSQQHESVAAAQRGLQGLFARRYL